MAEPYTGVTIPPGSFLRMAHVADMLAHSRPLPLIIDYVDKTSRHHRDEQCIILTLQHRDRVRRIRVLMPVPNLQKLIATIDKVLYFRRQNARISALRLSTIRP
jgi:hypothetical protein